jgi:hypothetical protein
VILPCSLSLNYPYLIIRIFGPNRDEVTGGWRKLHNEELHNLYSSPSILRMIKSRRIRWAGHVVRMGEKRNAYMILVGKPGGQRSLGRPRCRTRTRLISGVHVTFGVRSWRIGWY